MLRQSLLVSSFVIAAAAPAQQPRVVPIGDGWAKNSVNAAIFRYDPLVTHEGTQFAAFYDGQGRVVLARRRLGSRRWTRRVTELTGNVRDAHNVICVMVDGDGYLHVAWDHHDAPLRYCRSKRPGSLELTERLPMLGEKEQRVTYPEFHRLANGDLLFLYRDGMSGRGSLVMNRYDTASKTWSRMHDVLISGEGRRNPYWQMCIDDAGTAHLSWVWRESPDAASNHDLGYARSVDGGVTWTRSDGTGYEMPIVADGAEYAARIPQRRGLINTTSMCADSEGRPYIASYWRPEGSDVPQYHVVFLREDGWRVQQVSEREQPYLLGGGGTRRIPMSRPRIFADCSGAQDRAWIVFRDEERDSRVSLCACDDLEQGRWTTRDLTEFSVGQWEPSYDTELWRKQHELHLYVQRVGQGQGERTEDLEPTEVAVLEWRPAPLQSR